MLFVGIVKRREYTPSVDVARVYQVFGNLHCVEGSPLAYLVAGEPQRDAVVVGEVFADASYIDIILAGRFKRHGVHIVLWVINEGTTRCGGNGIAHGIHVGVKTP